MATVLIELFGDVLLQFQEDDKKLVEVSTKQLDGKIVALYFSSHRWPYCQEFTLKLAQVYRNVYNEINEKFEIIFISRDKCQTEFNESFKEMPWKAIPFQDGKRLETLYKNFKICGSPSLIILSSSGEIITSEGSLEFSIKSDSILFLWSQGKSLFHSCQPQPNEFQWNHVHCDQCYMRPLVGIRYGCINRQCQFNFCKKCIDKIKHEHPLVEYLVPNRQYSMNEFFASVPYLLNSNKQEQVKTEILWKDDVKAIGFYFLAYRYSFNCDLTQKLIQDYKATQPTINPFPIVIISYDIDEQLPNKYWSNMPWFTIPSDYYRLFYAYFTPHEWPALIVMSIDGKVLTHFGHHYILRQGSKAIQCWSRGEKVAVSTPDDYVWQNISCNECNMIPIIGKRYHCSICENYDLCFACQLKGHEHLLELM
ncbi:unnamed protein product [Rotaria sordida]|uniref:protein-disulfide reductase n=2 Tax=Rotaria sordida TaxID=392033 RepID=A0A816DCD3_9BILA|nr:unnamed protein product [Rotaria sordida]CAF1435923.1 unnamed protein product [Rotaria sordida]CAF1442721.1 unnamed protein product [Rotaria sordida]CAF1634152.1 unnamed protein product [Rotaria sordida]CAF3906876.1 unnamed protein product [Rotaria sordida]